MRAIRIESTPPGDAPVHIREAWVGLVLPLADVGTKQPAICTSRSVLPNKSGFFSGLLRKFRRELEEQPVPGYVVDANAAVKVLGNASPQAAEWWRTNASHMLHEGRRFLFPTSCCAELHDA